jgi:hypothetical protein
MLRRRGNKVQASRPKLRGWASSATRIDQRGLPDDFRRRPGAVGQGALYTAEFNGSSGQYGLPCMNAYPCRESYEVP